MLTVESMAAGLTALSVAFNRPVDRKVGQVYLGVLGPKLSEEQWERAVHRALEAETFFPAPAVLLRYGLAEGVPQARAVVAYNEILGSYESGSPLYPRDIEARFGTAAMEGFLAAGGTRAFEWCEPRDEPFRRKAFVEGFVETAEQDPALALPSGEKRPALPTGEEFTKAEAVGVLAELQRRTR